MDRRGFLQTAGLMGGALAFPARAMAAQSVTASRISGGLYLDAQGVIDGFDMPDSGRYVLGKRLLNAIAARQMDLISITVGSVGNGPDRFHQAVEDLARLDRMIADYPSLLTKIKCFADMQAARQQGKLGLIYNFQDTTALEADAGKVATFAALGIKVMQLTYNKRNLAGDGCLETANAGLSDFGREVISKMEEAHVLLDLSHAGQRTIAEGIDASTRSPAITHSGCRALVDLPRNTRDAEMRALADKGGVFGVYLMPFLRPRGQPGAEDLLRHLDHAVTICGEDHVGIGTDNPLLGYDLNETTRRQHRESHEARVKRGVAAPGEQPDVLLYVEGYNAPDRFERIAADLRRRGWSSARIEKIMGGNFARLFGAVWQA